MRHFTITLLGEVKERCLKVPSKWSEITTAQFMRLLSEPETSPLLILSDLTEAQLEAGNGIVGLDLIVESLNFLNDVSDLQELLPDPYLPTIGGSTYGQLLLAMQYLDQRDGVLPLLNAPYLSALYRSQQLNKNISKQRIQRIEQAILESPITEVYAELTFYLDNLAAFWQLHTTDPDPDDGYTDEELDAGAEELEQYGPFVTLDMLAGGDATKYEQVLAMDADTMLQKVHFTQLQNRVQRRMSAQQLANMQNS